MPHTTVLFVHLQYDAPDSPQSCALRALAATIARTSAPPLIWSGATRMTTLTRTVSHWPSPRRCASRTRTALTRPWLAISERMSTHWRRCRWPSRPSCGQEHPRSCWHKWQANSTPRWC
jgi:hypothetical protein